MGYPLKKEDKRYTYGDYLSWPEEERWELIEGIAYDMSPSPSRIHQRISGELFYQFTDYLKNKPCEVYAAPFDVRLPKKNERDEDIETVVQPDIVVVCDKSKLDDKGCRGSPDLIIEITSQYTAQKDMKAKFLLYEKRGVKEYWIVHQADKTVMVFKMRENGEYGKPMMYSEEDKIEVNILGNLVVDLKPVFKEKEV
ncbi:MAG: Uma2 family endonuclease [Nitrospinae bacterium]|nr:Uma2 family endonuclease [Nitrospinota bacterium]MBI3813650.1 Uma2 family endonuclease [Nitrospinota bacterium]